MFTGSYWSTHFFVIGHASQKWCSMPRKAMVVNAKQSQKFRDINLLISKLAKQSAIVMKMKDFDNIAVVNCLDMIWSGLTTMSSLQLWVEVIEKFPHWPFSQTELMSPWTHHVLFLFKSFLNHYIYHRHFRCCSSILSFDWSVKVRLMYLTVEFKKLVRLAFRRRCWNIISFGLRHFPQISPAAVPWTSLFRTLEHLLPQ